MTASQRSAISRRRSCGAGFVKVDTMENPFRLPDALRKELGERLAEVALNRYPAERGDVLRAELAKHANMPADCEIMLGNGSDELISLLALAADVPGNVILAPLPGFVMYEMSAKLQGLRFVGVPLSERFELDEDAMLQAIERHRPAITYIAYPNNPTANLFDEKQKKTGGGEENRQAAKVAKRAGPSGVAAKPLLLSRWVRPKIPARV